MYCFRCSFWKVMLFQGFSCVWNKKESWFLRKILVTPKIFLKSRVHCTVVNLLWSVIILLAAQEKLTLPILLIILKSTQWNTTLQGILKYFKQNPGFHVFGCWPCTCWLDKLHTAFWNKERNFGCGAAKILRQNNSILLSYPKLYSPFWLFK